MDELPISKTAIELIDLEILEESLGEFDFEQRLEKSLNILDDRHRDLQIAANTLIKERTSWLHNVKNLLLPSLKK